MPSGPSSLKEKGTVMRRPSNSGIATCMAASIGLSPPSAACHWAREEVRHRPWRIGTPRVARAPASQSPSAPPSAAAEPPAARTVVMTAWAGASSSRRPSSAERSEAQWTWRGGDAGGAGREKLAQALVGGAQRAAVDRERGGALAGDGLAQAVDEAGVAGELVGAVKDHGDRGGPGGWRGWWGWWGGGGWGGLVG